MKEKVLIWDCDKYDKCLIATLVNRGIKVLGSKPSGKVFLKPNVVFAYKDFENTESTYTHPEFIAGVVNGLNAYNISDKDSMPIKRVEIGEKAGIGVPTRMAFSEAGYYRMFRRIKRKLTFPLRIFSIEEDKRKKVQINGKVHSTLRLSGRVVKSDFVVSVPKLKKHGIRRAGITCAMKLNIGIMYGDERGRCHDYRLDDKIVDAWQGVTHNNKPQLIVVDAIDAGVGMEVGARGRHLGVIIMGTSHQAIDLVAGHIYGLRPPEKEVPYIKSAVERGFFPTSLDDVEIMGDYQSVEDLDKIVQKFEPYDEDFNHWINLPQELERVGSPIRYFHGPYKTEPQKGYCESCQMPLKILFNMTEGICKADFSKGKGVVLVTGKHEEIDAKGKDAILIGGCAEVKKWKNVGKVRKVRKCFTTLRDLILFRFSSKIGLPNPIFSPRFFVIFLWSYLRSILQKILNGYYISELIYFFKNRFLTKI